MSPRYSGLIFACGLLMAIGLGCTRPHKGDGGKPVIRVEGSDTMVNVAQAWAEEYHRKNPTVSVQVLGGGSGVGIASLIEGNCDMADTSRKMKPAEIEAARSQRGVEPKEIVVGYDALAIYVHRNNPLDAIAIDELAGIYGNDGKITKWSQLGVKGPLAEKAIVRVSRQSSSGTYTYFREAVLGPGKDYKLGSIDQSGSKDVVALVSRTPAAIGYSGMGYDTPEVKMLKVSKRRGEPAVTATVANAEDDSYPITRPLQIYVLGTPKGAVKEYLDWILSATGQKVVLDLGYVPVKSHR
jgi:phosphate transport system substrate-binding protein